jgi:hypothetical protein
LRRKLCEAFFDSLKGGCPRASSFLFNRELSVWYRPETANR